MRKAQVAETARAHVYSTVAKERLNGTQTLQRNMFRHTSSNTFTEDTNRRLGSVTQLTDSHGRSGSTSSSLLFGYSAEDHQRRIVMVQDRLRWWYKPDMPRDEIVRTLLKMRSGSFLVRKSNTYAGAYGVAIRVEQVPSSAPTSGDPEKDLIRHFLVERSSKGVRVRGFPDEPAFSSLAALIYQHTVTPLGLPCRLILPDYDPAPKYSQLNHSLLSLLSLNSKPSTQEQKSNGNGMADSLESLQHDDAGQGISVEVLYAGAVDVESLTGQQAVARAFDHLSLAFRNQQQTSLIEAKLTVNRQGVTITDVNRKYVSHLFAWLNNIFIATCLFSVAVCVCRTFFRKHLPIASILYVHKDQTHKYVFQN